MQHATPAAPAVRETLVRLLNSRTFSRSERARNLLRYLVEREQAGEADKLKGFAIAVDVFGRDADFDSSTDAVVRVQAGRLRDLLAQYYATEGAADPLRIEVPRGCYVPHYLPGPQAAPPALSGARDTPLPVGMETEREAEAETNADPPAAPVARHRSGVPWLAAAATGLPLALLGFFLLAQASLEKAMPGENAGNAGPGAVTRSVHASTPDELPVLFLAIEGQRPSIQRVGAAMRTGLSGFDTIEFIGREPPSEPDEIVDPISFLFRVGAGPQPDSIAVELQNIGSGGILFSRVFTEAEISPAKVDDVVAGMLSAAIPASGTIYTYLDRAGLDRGLTRCLLLNDDYYLDPNKHTHEAAYRCFENLLAQKGKSPLIPAELAALHLEAVTDGYAYPPGASAEKAMAMAHRSLQMAAASPYVYRANGFIHSRIGDPDDSIKWMRKAYELNTYDLSMAAAYAYGLIFAGDYAEGTPIMARAVELSSAHPQWWDFGLFAGALSLGNTERAIRASVPLNPAGTKAHYLAARLIAADLAGDRAARAQLNAELGRRFPSFADDPRAIFQHRNYPPDLTDRLVKALRNAGFGTGS